MKGLAASVQPGYMGTCCRAPNDKTGSDGCFKQTAISLAYNDTMAGIAVAWGLIKGKMKALAASRRPGYHVTCGSTPNDKRGTHRCFKQTADTKACNDPMAGIADIWGLIKGRMKGLAASSRPEYHVTCCSAPNDKRGTHRCFKQTADTCAYNEPMAISWVA